MLRVALQAAFLVLVAVLLYWLYFNLVTNLRARRIGTDFGFLEQPAGFAITGTDFRSTRPIWAAILVGLRNTMYVSLIGIMLATALGTVVGVLRLSTNWLVRRSASLFVEAFRNVPLLVLIIFLYLAVLQTLPRLEEAISPLGAIMLAVDGLWVPWADTASGIRTLLWAAAGGLLGGLAVAWWRTQRFDRTGQPHHRVLWGAGVFMAVGLIAWLATGRPLLASFPTRDGRLVTGGLRLTLEYGALLVALTLYTAAFVAEIVRGSIQAVPKGQSEASTAVGLSPFQRLRFVILPQSLRIAVPPTGNEFLNLTKNSSLGIAIAFPELLRLTRIVIGNGHPAPQAVAIMMGIYLSISLTLSALTNVVNRWLQRRGGA